MTTDEMVLAAYDDSIFSMANEPVGSRRSLQSQLVTPVATGGAFLWILLAGTAGTTAATSASPLLGEGSPTGANCNVQYNDRRRRRSDSGEVESNEDATPGVGVELAKIQHQLGVNVSELSNIMRVSRPTVYAWLRGDAEPHTSNLIRIGEVDSLIYELTSNSGISIARLTRRHLTERHALLALLGAASIDKAAILEHVGSLKALGTALPNRRVLDLMRQRGMPERPVGAEQRSLSEETGV